MFLNFFRKLFSRKNEKLVYLESPYAGDVELNVRYARACMKDCLNRGEFPFASHLLYTQPHILDDLVAEERKLGINAGFAWAQCAHKTVMYTDLGFSRGMMNGLRDAQIVHRKIELRKLPEKMLHEVYCVKSIQENYSVVP